MTHLFYLRFFFTTIQAWSWTGADNQFSHEVRGMENEISILEENSIRSKIHVIRGQQVMLDFDLLRFMDMKQRILIAR